MQSWSNNGQNGADETQHQWHNNYAFAGQNGQFDPHQPWSQPVSEQAAYSQLNPQDASPSNFFDSDQSHPFLSSTLHGSQQDQAGYHPSHDSLSMNQQFPQQSQDVMDTDFSGIHPDIYGQHGKMNLDNTMAGIGQLSSHPHSTNFPYSMAPQNESSFEPSIQQFSQQHVMPQTSRQQSHTPVQQFDSIPSAYTPGHNFSRPPQPSPVQNQQQYNQAAFSPPVNGQTPQPRPNEQLNFQQGHPQARQQPQPQQQPPKPQQQMQQNQPQKPSPQPQQQPPKPQQQMQQNQPQKPSPQPQFAPKQPVAYPQTSQPLPGQNFQQSIHHQQPPHFINNATSPPTANTQYILSQPGTNQETGALQPATNEPPPKKRKRAVKTEVNTPTPTPEPTAAYIDSPVGSPAVKKIDDLDGLSAPTPTPEEAQLINQFNKRTKAAQAKFPAIRGLPHLVHEGTIKLPAPKSYDKLAPLVALPARSGRQMVPELGYSLPCEVQGRFTSQYRPSPDKGGLDERRMEAKVLLDDFDRSMKSLGKRRPKYTEYPHAFKEQLKSDEASKNKAEKKAKKELEEERGKPIRAATRPADPAEAAAWDAIGMVHIEQSVARTNALIASRVQQAGEYFIKLRSEMNRAKQELDQAIKDKKPDGVVARDRQDFEQKKEILYRALDATIEHADDAVLDNLGGHQKLVLSLVNALIMCIKASDFSGKLPKIVLEMFTHFPMTKKIAETTNFETVRKRFADKGDSEVKELVSEITVKVKKLKASESESTGYQGTSASSRAKAKPGLEPSAKRGRDEEAETRTVKKIAVESSGNALSRKLAQPKIQLQSASKTSAAKAAAASILPGKPRPVAKPAPKPETKADLKVISDDKIKAEAKPSRTETKPPAPRNGTTTAPTSSSASALSGIASLLDSINAPKVEAPVAPKETNGPETSESPEEKAKRLRKEARRKLRVSWKPETELVQIRIFQKEEAEDEGRESNMTRDAADDRSEGMVLKQRANVEEEEDDEDVPYQPWMGPVAIDFSRLPTDVRNKNFVTRGGNVTFTTDEQQRIADREQRELMAIYTDPDDIPPSPKSPIPEVAGTDQQKTQYLPDDSKFQEIQVRWRDEQQMGSDGALYTALQRIEAKNNPGTRLDSILGNLRGVSSAARTSPQHASQSQHHPALANDTLPLIAGRAVLEQVIALLKSDKVKSWRDSNPITTDAWRAFHYSDTPTRLCGGAIEGVAKSLAGMPFPSNSPPEWILHDQEKVREWQMGHNKELVSRQKRADEERARAEAEANALQAAAVGASSGQAPANPQDWAAYYAQQQQAYAPYMALLQQIQPQPQTTTAPVQQQPQIPDTQLQSILAAINQPSQAPGQASTATPNAASYLNPNDPSYQQYMMLTQMAQGQQVPPPPPPPAAEREWDRDRAYNRDRDQDRGWDRERTYDRDRDDHHGARGDRDGKDGRKKKPTLPPHKPANKALIGTKPCTFWQQGKCARGDKCTFRHD